MNMKFSIIVAVLLLSRFYSFRINISERQRETEREIETHCIRHYILKHMVLISIPNKEHKNIEIEGKIP